MGRLTRLYSPDALVLTERVRAVCSSTTLTVALGITPPDESVTSPVMPPSVCCAGTMVAHSATAATNTSSREIGAETKRMKCLTLHSLGNRDFPCGPVGETKIAGGLKNLENLDRSQMG